MDKYLKENEVMEDQQSTEQQINQTIAPNEAFLSQPQPEVKTSATNSSKKNAFTKFLSFWMSMFTKKSTEETNISETSLATTLEDDPNNIVGHFNTPETGEYNNVQF